MAKPWKVVARWTDGGQSLELQQRATAYRLVADDEVLTTSDARPRQQALVERTLSRIAPRQILLAGLGLGDTLREVLDAIPADAHVSVCEMTETIVEWNRGALAPYNGGALGDPRVDVVVGEASEVIAGSQRGVYDAILLDLFFGPSRSHAYLDTGYYGAAAIERIEGALRAGGAVGVWSEKPHAAFEKRLVDARLAVEAHPTAGGVIYVGRVTRPAIDQTHR